MVNHRLRRALAKSGVDIDALAESVGVDRKTVAKWLQGSIPYEKNRSSVAAILAVDPIDLWPDTGVQVKAAAEIITAWSRRSDCPPDYWWRYIQESNRQIDILGYAVLFLTENHADLLDVLAKRMDHGCNVRIILADPSAATTRARDEEEGLDGALVARVKTSLKYLSPLFDTSASVRFQAAPMYSSVFRFDDDMLVTPHLYAIPGKHAPMLHLRRLGVGGLFDQFARHFEGVWSDTTPEPGVG